MRSATLVALAHAPLLGADDLAVLCGIGERGARRALDARVAAGEAGAVTNPATRRHLYYLTAAGVAAAARLMDSAPEELARRYGLGESALLHRLPALNRLIAGRRVLLQLATALSHTGGDLHAWRTFPVRWPYHRGSRTELLVLDGEATLRFADGLSCVVGYLWDGDPEAPPDALAVRLERLAAARADPDYAPPSTMRVPPVLLVTAAAARVPPGYRPGLLWTTVGAVAVATPLAAGWASATGRDADEGARHVRAALDHLGTMPPRPTPGSQACVPRRIAAPTSSDTLRRRAVKVRDARDAESAHKDLLTLPLVLPPRAWPLLTCVGRHPLLDRRDLATVLESDPFDVWEVLRVLCHHGLCQASRSRTSARRAWRYSLTTRGTDVLARAEGFDPITYRRIYGMLDNAKSPGERGLSYAQENLEHTDGINAAFLIFLAGARARGGTLWWRGEWACTRQYEGEGRDGRRGPQLLRPDAEMVYDGPGSRLRAFIEVDRNNEPARDLARKIDQYDAYRAHSGDNRFAVLIVTPGLKRGNGPLAHARELARDRLVPLLDVRTTTAAALASHGPWAPIWRSVYDSSDCLDDHVATALTRSASTSRARRRV